MFLNIFNLTTTTTGTALDARQGTWLYNNKLSNANGSVTSNHIADKTIVNGDIADTTIETGKIKNGAIDSIVDGQMAKANIQDPNVSEELERIANQINGNFPKAYNGNLENNQQSNKKPAGNLVFL